MKIKNFKHVLAASLFAASTSGLCADLEIVDVELSAGSASSITFTPGSVSNYRLVVSTTLEGTSSFADATSALTGMPVVSGSEVTLNFTAVSATTAFYQIVEIASSSASSRLVVPTIPNKTVGGVTAPVATDFIADNDGSAVTFDTTVNGWVLNSDATMSGEVILTNKLFVKSGVELTIAAGTTIYNTLHENGTPADKTDDEFGSIVITRGATINAAGTAASPFVMTTVDTLEVSSAADIDGQNGTATAPTKDTQGRWGGLIVLGNDLVANYSSGALVNEKEIEGFAPAFSADADGDGRSDIIEYGGGAIANPETVNASENSGVIQYVSIRHGGYEFSDGEEINGLTLGGVGAGTTIDHVEVYANQDDGIEFFGGSVNTSYLVMAFNDDDSFDIDDAHDGEHQFWVAIQNADNDADNGGEWDGNSSGNRDGLGATWNSEFRSSPIIANATFVGDTILDSDSSKTEAAFAVEDSFEGFVYDAVVVGFADVFKDKKASDSNNLTLTNVTFEGSIAAGSDELDVFGDGTAGSLGSKNNNLAVTDAELTEVQYTGISEYDLRPKTGAAILSNGTSGTIGTSALTGTGYRGAFDGTTNWAAGWTAVKLDGTAN